LLINNLFVVIDLLILDLLSIKILSCPDTNKIGGEGDLASTTQKTKINDLVI